MDLLTVVMLSLAPICSSPSCDPVPFVQRPLAVSDYDPMLRLNFGPISTDEAPACTSCGAAPSVVVPEPSTYAMLVAGVVVLGVLARRRHR
jgi:hypothetical protein